MMWLAVIIVAGIVYIYREQIKEFFTKELDSDNETDD